jgi:hypothetical protein
MLFGTFHLTSIMLLATVSALNEEVPSETEVPVNGFVMGVSIPLHRKRRG